MEKQLINCYVFVHITKEGYLPVLETENVTGFVKSNKDSLLIHVDASILGKLGKDTA